MTRPVVLKIASRVVMTALILALALAALTVLAIAGYIAALTFRSLPDRRPQSRLRARTREVER